MPEPVPDERPVNRRRMPSWLPGTWPIALLIALGCSADSSASRSDRAASAGLMTPGELQRLPSSPPDERSAYGTEPSQYGELRIPAGAGPHPVAILIHGGCFKEDYATVRDLAAMADALKDRGIASWNVEYRRLGEPGGGWPGTYLDVAHAVEHLATLAEENRLDLSRVAAIGHSAGGHLAMWVAARSRVPAGSDIQVDADLPLRGVLDLAGPVDLTANIEGYESLCRDAVITKLLGGTPVTVPDRYSQASPMALLPMGIPQIVLIGEHENFVPQPLLEAYVQAAAEAGDSVRLVVVPGVGHFEIASPQAETWGAVESAIRSLLDGRLPGA